MYGRSPTASVQTCLSRPTERVGNFFLRARCHKQTSSQRVVTHCHVDWERDKGTAPRTCARPAWQAQAPKVKSGQDDSHGAHNLHLGVSHRSCPSGPRSDPSTCRSDIQSCNSRTIHAYCFRTRCSVLAYSWLLLLSRQCRCRRLLTGACRCGFAGGDAGERCLLSD